MVAPNDFTPREREFLQDIVNWWEEGLADAAKDVEKDPSLEDLDIFMEAVAGMQEQKELLLSIKGKLDLGGLAAA